MKGTGNTVIKAIAVLKEHNVIEENIILSNLFCTPIAAKSLVTAFPQVCILSDYNRILLDAFFLSNTNHKIISLGFKLSLSSL